MTKITVLDSIMGSGKSTYVINMMNEAWLEDMITGFNDPHHKHRKFLVLVPLLTEVDRYIRGCPDLRFKKPEPYDRRKIEDLELLVEAGENIVTTHQLFSLLTRGIYQKLTAQGYTLIIDEALECVELFTELTDSDLPLTFHPAAIRASADFAPIGAGGATADLRSWSGLRSGSAVAERLAAKATGVR